MTMSGANIVARDPFGDRSADTPVISPDGTKVALLRRGYDGLWLADANTLELDHAGWLTAGALRVELWWCWRWLHRLVAGQSVDRIHP